MRPVEMIYRRLGECGTKVSVLGLGGWTTFGESIPQETTAAAILREAFDAGVNFFDMADIYAKGGAERIMGAALRQLPRHRLVLSSKVFWPMSDDVNDRGLSRKHIFESIEKSLKRVGTDYLDLYFCHRFDPDTPVEETARAMDDLVRQGKILYWGTSEWSGEQIREVSRLARGADLYRPQIEQPQFSLLERRRVEEDVRPAAIEFGMGLVTWSPLASGVLTGKYDGAMPEGARLTRLGWLRERYLTPEIIARVRELGTVAAELGCSRAQLAIAWVAAQPGVSSVNTGATSPSQLKENLGALRVEPQGEVLARLDALFPPR